MTVASPSSYFIIYRQLMLYALNIAS